MSLEPANSAGAASSSRAHVGFLFSRMWDCLLATRGWLWVSPEKARFPQP